MTLAEAIKQALDDMDPGPTYSFSSSRGLIWYSNDRDGDYSTTDFRVKEFISRVSDLLAENLEESQTVIEEKDGRRLRLTVEVLE